MDISLSQLVTYGLAIITIALVVFFVGIFLLWFFSGSGVKEKPRTPVEPTLTKTPPVQPEPEG